MANEPNSIHESYVKDDAQSDLFEQQQPDDAAATAEPAITTGALESTGKQGAASETDSTQQEERATVVPYNALHEERLLRKETQQQLRQQQEEMAVLKARLAVLDKLEARFNERQTKEQAAAEEEQFETDPIATLKQKTVKLEEKLTAKEQAEAKAEENRNLLIKVQQDISKRVREFMTEVPDYPDAFQHLMTQRIAEFQAMGIDNPAQIQQAFDRYSMEISIAAIQRGKNPGAVVYELAKAAGYKKAAPKTETTTETVDEQLDKLEKGNKAAQSLSKGGAPVNAKKLSLADIDHMSDDDIDSLWDEMRGKGTDDLGI